MTLKGKFVQTGDTVNGDKNSFCRVWIASHGSGRKWDKAFVITGYPWPKSENAVRTNLNY